MVVQMASYNYYKLQKQFNFDWEFSEGHFNGIDTLCNSGELYL